MGASIVHVLDMIFGPDVPVQPLPLYQIGTRAVAVYLIGVAIVRIGKSRLISRTTPLDVILAFILGSLLSRGITGSASLSATTVACVAMVAMHWILTLLAVNSHTIGFLFKGSPSIVVQDGVVNAHEMRRSHISQQDLLEHLRLHANLEDITKVKRAYKERSGEISVVRKDPEPRVVDVSVAQGVQTVRIQLA